VTGTKYVHDGLQHLNGAPGLKHKQVVKLKAAIAQAIRPLPVGIRTELWPPFQNDVLHNPSLRRKAVEMVVHARLGVADIPFSLAVHQESQDIFKVETDLHHRLNISELEGHKVVEAGLMGIAGLSQSIMEIGSPNIPLCATCVS